MTSQSATGVVSTPKQTLDIVSGKGSKRHSKPETMGSRARFASILSTSFLLLLLRSAEPLGLRQQTPLAGGELLGVVGRYLTREERWMNQRLDHFSPIDHRQFKQRYFEFLDYHDAAATGPVFLRICGESSCDGIPNDYLAVLAKRFGAAVVTPEHRYYGKSSPFENLTTENLRFLSSKQALFDLAVFRQYYQETLNSRHNRSSGFENPWFVFGVSYAGALSAWFRLKFPHLTCGSLASSGVVLAVYNFTDFDKQETTRLVDEQLRSDSDAVKALFGARTLKNDGDFLFLLADAAATTFQYGNPDAVCSPLTNAKKNGKDLVETYVQFVKDYCIKKLGTTVSSYDQEYLKETTPDDSISRLWWFQVCSEVAYFQVAPKNDSVRSAKINTRYNLDLCKNVYGEGIYPDVFMTNLYYGGTSIAASKIVFTNGSQDPWRHASKQKSSKDMPSYLIKCSNCGHGTDLRGCPQLPFRVEGDSSNCTSPEAVGSVRQQIAKHIDLWLSQCHEPTRSGPGMPFALFFI